VARQLTVKVKSSGSLVYKSGGDIRVYDPGQDKELDPPDSNDADVIGPNAVDFTAGNNADIAFVSGSRKKMFSTEVGAQTQNEIKSSSPSGHRIAKQKTRMAVAEAREFMFNGSANSPNTPDIGETVVLYAAKDKSRIYAMDADGNTNRVLKSGNGAGGPAGVADIDNDDNPELVFIDGSAQLRYLDDDRTIQKIPNGGVGSNNSVGFGPPAEFNNLSGLQIPFIDGSNNPTLIDVDGNKTKLSTNGIARKLVVAPVDVDNDGDREFVFIGATDPYDNEIAYIDDVGGGNVDKELTIGSTVVSAKTDFSRAPDKNVGLNFGGR
jgi:hypothetical protein